MSWKFWIDTGGTFTDCLARDPSGCEHRRKVLSSSTIRARIIKQIDGRRLQLEGIEALGDAFFVGYRFKVYGESVREYEVAAWKSESSTVELDSEICGSPDGALCEFVSPEEPPVFAVRILTKKGLEESLPAHEMRLATTRGTNALLERKGAKTALFITKGFKDLLEIGDQRRPKLFELGIQKLDPLTAAIFEVEGRLDAAGNEIEALDEEGVRKNVRQAIECGFEAFSVALLHGYRNATHEKRVAAILREEGVGFVSVSNELAAFAKLLPRTETAVVDAYLSPIMDTYLDAVESVMDLGKRDQFEGSRGEHAPTFFRVMTSAGGLVSRGSYRAKDSLLSGPAGGVVGASRSGLQAGYERTIAFDMGGTSTDVSRFDGQFDYRFEQRIGAARVFAPSLRIETVAAGGGSICWFDGTALRVGPHSAGSNPGPACYGAGGPLAMTDVNLLLGRLDVSKFGIPVSVEAAKRSLSELQRAVREATGKEVETRDLLEGFLAIADETMAEAIRKISTSEGYDPSEYSLVAFGGAGGLHACEVARILGMDTIVFPDNAGLLSAAGLRDARVEQFAERQILRKLDECVADLEVWKAEASNEAFEKIRSDGVGEDAIALGEARYELRYLGQESVIVLEGGEVCELRSRFEDEYETQFGFLPSGLDVEVVALRVVASSVVASVEAEGFERRESSIAESFFIDRGDLEKGTAIDGPVVIQDAFSTVYVDTGWTALVGDRGTLKLMKSRATKAEVFLETAPENEVVTLELFTNRFLSLVEEMGALLERAAFSTNVKERKDFSCALLDADGCLVANAPHIPVHLGALGVCVREVLKVMDLEDGDVVVTNHPAYGGSHLPDVTLIAPVYSEDGYELLGYVANRAHHAEIGGIAPGSMPPHAKNLAEEGVVIAPIKVARAGVVDWAPVTRLLEGGKWRTRSLRENLADLSAQLAAARKGQSDLRNLAKKEGNARVKHFMAGLKNRAASALRVRLEEGIGGLEEQAPSIERLDSGAGVQVTVSRQNSGKWLIDFEGTAEVQPNNYNATPAIATSATMYVLRLLAGVELPLNEGFLDVVDIRIPEGMLNPNFDSDAELCPAVVAGNVEVSQLIVAVLLKRFGLAACSQATMNNFIFGTNRFGYYETIAGGEGATWERDGASGVHTHMTNTAMTDPEIMELRYPVRVEQFSLRSDSGGDGLRRGGEGLVKRIRFLEPVSLSLLTQRRLEKPFGMKWGDPGSCGEQWLETPDGNRVSLDGNGSWEISAGSVLEIRTPGGGGWGVARES